MAIMVRGTAARRVRRWLRTTPNEQIGMTLLGLGALCILVAMLFIGIESHWI